MRIFEEAILRAKTASRTSAGKAMAAADSALCDIINAVAMNLLHRWLCRSTCWKNTVGTHILPWVLEGIDIGPNVIEIGPGPGATTDLLRSQVASLTCVEIDGAFADSLRQRTAGQNVTVLHEDATAMS